MKIKVEKFLMKQGNRVGKAAIEFQKTDGNGELAGFHLVGFTVCDDPVDGMFILFPAAVTPKDKDGKSTRPYFFLRPTEPNALARLENAILDAFEQTEEEGYQNRPRMVGKVQQASPTV